MTQLALGLKRPIDEAFVDFDRANPQVYALFKRFAEELRARGRKRIGSKSIIERIRWFALVETDGEPWKINNNFTAHYARKLVAERPEFADLFEMRRLRS